jgi:hypothetical protein
MARPGHSTSGRFVGSLLRGAGNRQLADGQRRLRLEADLGYKLLVNLQRQSKNLSAPKSA